MSGAGRLDGVGDDVGEQHAGAPELHLVPADPGDVEQVVDEPDHVPELPLHHVAGLGDGVGVARRQPHHLQAVADRGERVAQLVGEQREELVLPPVGLLQRLLGPLPVGDVVRQPEDADRRGPRRR